MKIINIVKNSFFLGVFQLATYVVPFSTIPYFSRIFSPNEFGVIMTFIALVQFGYIVAEYGHNISATKKIIDKMDDVAAISRINTNVIFSKFIVIVIYTSLSFFAFYEMMSLEHVILLFLTLLFQAFQPVWYFNALEKFREFSILALVGKLTYIPLVYIFVDSESGASSIILSLLLSQVITLLLIFHFHKNLIKLSAMSVRDGLIELRGSSLFFLGRLSSNFQYFTLTPLVNFLLGPIVAGNFSIADNLSKAIRGLTGSINQALYPAVAKSKNERLFWLLVLSTTLMLTILCYIVSFISLPLIYFIFGDGYDEAPYIFNIMLITVVLYYFNACIGYPYFSIVNKLDLANKTAYIGGVVFLALIISCYFYFSDISVVDLLAILIFSELIVIAIRLCYIFLRKFK
ncbi:oligosaccharide flippase family protein [Vibrio chagasii]|uniref:oligosaccharide flippase family protein n=1 Tax=Vibrio chagasii TaxID=170679 RepID=UPI003DA06E87